MQNDIRWRKSSRSAEGAENCVELARTVRSAAIRDSKNPDGGALALTVDALESALSSVRSW